MPRRIASVKGGLKDAAQLIIMLCVELSSSIVLSSENVPWMISILPRLVRASSRAVLRRKAVRLC